MNKKRNNFENRIKSQLIKILVIFIIIFFIVSNFIQNDNILALMSAPIVSIVVILMFFSSDMKEKRQKETKEDTQYENGLYKIKKDDDKE